MRHRNSPRLQLPNQSIAQLWRIRIKRLEVESDVSNVGQPVQAAALKQPHDRVPDHRAAVVLGAPPHAASRVT